MQNMVYYVMLIGCLYTLLCRRRRRRPAGGAECQRCFINEILARDSIEVNFFRNSTGALAAAPARNMTYSIGSLLMGINNSI